MAAIIPTYTVTASSPHINTTVGATTTNNILIKLDSGRRIVLDESFLDYLNIISEILGIPLNYEKFCNLDQKERKSFIKTLKREIKLKDLDI
jgi:hypothetical protein